MAGLVLLWAGADGTVDPIQIPAHSATAALVIPKIVLMYSLYDTFNEADDDFGLNVNGLAISQESIHVVQNATETVQMCCIISCASIVAEALGRNICLFRLHTINRRQSRLERQ